MTWQCQQYYSIAPAQRKAWPAGLYESITIWSSINTTKCQENRGYFYGAHGVGASLVEILVHFGDSVPQNFYNDLAFQTALPCLQCPVLYCYDGFHHWYMTTKIFLDAGYIMSTVRLNYHASIFINMSVVQIDQTYFMALHLELPC